VTIGNSRYKVHWESMLAEPAAAPVEKAHVPVASRAEAIDDAVLESCEEPVPLAEPESPIPPAVPIAPRARKAEQAESIIIPEHLELAPLSDIIPPPKMG
jgi:hypothetical protein